MVRLAADSRTCSHRKFQYIDNTVCVREEGKKEGGEQTDNGDYREGERGKEDEEEAERKRNEREDRERDGEATG